MKCIIYCRKSTKDDDRQILSLASQKRELLELATKKKLDVVKIYSESASAKNLGRVEFASMIDDIKSGRADCILT